MPEKPSKRDETIQRVHALIGRATASWGELEFYINAVIWALAETQPAYGACITSQIYTINGRLSALLALLKLRRVSKATITKVNQFSESVRAPSEKRNRITHDPWGFGAENGSPSQIKITAYKKLEFSFHEVDIDKLDEDVQAIEKCVEEFVRITDRIFTELPSLPDIPLSELRPKFEGRRRQK